MLQWGLHWGRLTIYPVIFLILDNKKAHLYEKMNYRRTTEELPKYILSFPLNSTKTFHNKRTLMLYHFHKS